MIITNDNGLSPYIKIWRGDIEATAYDLRVVNTTSEVITLFKSLSDITPEKPTIMLAPDNEVWATLPNGEYEYYVEVKGRIVAAGLLRNIKREKDYEFSTEHYYTEYRRE